MADTVAPVTDCSDARRQQPLPTETRRFRQLIGTASLLMTACVILTLLSEKFAWETAPRQRPIGLFVVLATGMFACHLIGLRIALQVRDSRPLRMLIIGFAIGFRVVLLPSHPVQEVDIYRYLWDGEVVANLQSPFQFSPQQVRTIELASEDESDLQQLKKIASQSSSTRQTLQRVHFGQFTTVYPPVAQAVFGAAAAVTPDNSSLRTRTVIMKGFIVTFDLSVLVMMMILLRRTGIHSGWAIAYGWCPLVLKEFANSGHLDAIAVSLTLLTVLIWLRTISGRDRWASIRSGGFCGGVLAAAAAAKLYPVILAPLLCIVILQRTGWRVATAFTLTFCLLFTVLMLPMTLPFLRSSPATVASDNTSASEQTGAGSATAQSAESGLAVFLRQWEMNDLIFMLLVENLRTGSSTKDNESPAPIPWFVVIPQNTRSRISSGLTDLLQVDSQHATFAATRLATLGVFSLIALALAVRAAQQPEEWRLVQCVFLTIAWFWALSPTQNPWYWTWAIPFLPFTVSRSWMMISGLLFLYYLRFLLIYHFASEPVLATPYRGENFFHFAVVPIEHGCWMLGLMLESLRRPAGKGLLKESIARSLSS